MAQMLVIDDDAATRDAIAGALSNAGHEVLTAEEGREGMARCREHKPDLVIIDIFMPGMEGLETIQTLRRMDKKLKILAISASPHFGQALQAARLLGATRTLGKPFAYEDLLKAVAQMLEEN